MIEETALVLYVFGIEGAKRRMNILAGSDPLQQVKVPVSNPLDHPARRKGIPALMMMPSANPTLVIKSKTIFNTVKNHE